MTTFSSQCVHYIFTTCHIYVMQVNAPKPTVSNKITWTFMYKCSAATTTTNLCHTKVLRHGHAIEPNYRKDTLNRTCSVLISHIYISSSCNKYWHVFSVSRLNWYISLPIFFKGFTSYIYSKKTTLYVLVCSYTAE